MIVFVAGALLAMTVALLTFVAALWIGLALWLGARYGIGRTRRGAAQAHARTEVIDIEMREIERDRTYRRSDTAR